LCFANFNTHSEKETMNLKFGNNEVPFEAGID